MGNGFCCGCCAGAALIYLLVPGKACAEDVKHPSAAMPSANLESQLGVETENRTAGHGVGGETSFLVQQIEKYQRDISPRLTELSGGEQICRYEPSCSEYAKQAIQKHGNVKGSLMAAARLVRCNPASAGGYDPVK